MIIMSISGSIVLIIYFISKPLLMRFLPAHLRYSILKIIMIFYILPIPIAFISSYFIRNSYLENSIKVNIYLDKTIQLTPEVIILFNKYKLLNVIKFLLFIWFIIIFFILIKNIYQYLKLKKVLNTGIIIHDSSTQNLFNILKNYYNIKTNVILKKSNFIQAPISFGFLTPTIFLPNISMEEEELEMVLSHELIHIKHCDLKIKSLCLLIIILHWFNPLCYLLSRELNNVCEYVCDETYIQNANMIKRKAYGHLLLQMSEYNIINKQTFIASFCGKNILKRRIELMLKINNHRKFNFLISLVIILFFTLLGTSTVYACNSIQIVKWESENQNSRTTLNNKFLYSETESQNIYTNAYDSSNISSIQGYVVDNDTLKEIYSHDNDQERASCKHSFDPRTYINHTKYVDGSCTMDNYSSKICIKCGYIIIGQLEQSTFYKKCSH